MSPGRRPSYSMKLPALADCENCPWVTEGRKATTIRKAAADHHVATGHRIRMDQITTTVWDVTHQPQPQ